MNWEEIIISALRNNENLGLAMEKAAKVAPEEIVLLLRTFTEKIYEIAPKLDRYPKVLSLLYFHFLSTEGESFSTYPPEQQEAILKTSVDASFKASLLSHNLGEKGLQAHYLVRAATSLYHLQEFHKAEKVYNEALQTYRTLAKENPDAYSPYVAFTLNNLGVLYKTVQKFDEAENSYKEALEIKRNLAQENPAYTPDVAMTLNNLAVLYSKTAKFFEAERAFTEVLKIYKDLSQKNPDTYAPYVAATLNNLGNLCCDTQELSEAGKFYKEALEIERDLARKNPAYTPDVAMTLNNLGTLYGNTQQFDEAEHVYKEALEIERDLARKNIVYTPDVAMTLTNLGNVYNDMQRFDEAEQTFTEALQLYRELAEENPEAFTYHMTTALNSLATLYQYTKRFSKAERTLIEVLTTYENLAKENPDVYTLYECTALNNIATFYWDTGNTFQAENAYTKALEKVRALAQKNPDAFNPYVATTLNNLGNLYWNTEEFLEAEEVFTEALQIRRSLAEKNSAYNPDLATILNNLGNLYWKTKDFQRAESYYDEALKIRRSLAEQNPDAYTSYVAGTLINAGNLYKDSQKFSQAKIAYEEALEKYKRVGSWFRAADVVYNMSLIEPDKKILEQSRRILEMAILFTEEEKYRYAQKRAHEYVYTDLLEQNVDNEQETDSFGVLETLRDPELLSLSWSSIVPSEERERTWENRAFQGILVEKILKEHVPSLELPGTLPEEVLFIYIQELKDWFFFFVVEDGGTQKYKCKKDFSLIGDKLLRNLRIQRGAAQRMDDLTTVVNKFEMYSKKWSEMLPEGIRRLIQENDQIVFSPDSYCSFLPLEALQIDGEYLCIEKTVVRAASFHQFLTLLGKKPLLDSSLVMGNPWPQCDEKKLIYSLPSKPEYFRIPSLQNAQEEASVLTKKLPKGTVLLGQNATGERFLSEISKHSLIHFSGHGDLGRILFLSGPFEGFPPPFEPEEFSNLRKAERTKGTKKINMMEEWHPVTDLDLFDIPLTDGAVVFLNACETGQHKYAGGGYYQGLPAVFLKNGAHSVVSSLVPIFDDSSKEFALHFYETLLHTQSVAKSLKKARVWIRDKYEAQIYWVPYIHYGPSA